MTEQETIVRKSCSKQGGIFCFSYLFLSHSLESFLLPHMLHQFQTTLGLAVRRIFEEREGELLVSDSNVEQYQARFRVIDDYILNGKP